MPGRLYQQDNLSRVINFRFDLANSDRNFLAANFKSELYLKITGWFLLS